MANGLDLPKDTSSRSIQALGLTTPATVLTISDGTAQNTSVFSTVTNVVVRVACDIDIYIAMGAGATATSSDAFMPANRVEYFKVSSGERLSVIRKNGSDTGEASASLCK